MLLFRPYKTQGKSGQFHGDPRLQLLAALVRLSAVEKTAWCDGGGVRDQVVHRKVFLFTVCYLMGRAWYAKQNGFNVFL